MKFAVLEYTSKSGRIWRHTDERPNYLADPQQEIDATSFGCYVSALKGEHIPLVGLILGPVNPVNPITVAYRKIVKRVTGNWPSRYSLNYLTQFDVLLVVHQLSDAHELTAFITRIKQQPNAPLIIGVPTQPFGIIREAIKQESRHQENLIDFMHACDVFISIVKSTVPWYKKHTDTPVEYMPQPYPVTYASSHFKSLSAKDNILFIAGVTERANIKKGQLVARQLQRRFPTLKIHVTRIAGAKLDLRALKGSKVEIQEFQPWQEHLSYLSKVRLVINTDYTFTRGRVQVDCAAVGTPSLGANSDAQHDLFPGLPGDEADSVERLLELAKPLLIENNTYNRTVNIARHELDKYNYARSAQRMKQIVATYT